MKKLELLIRELETKIPHYQMVNQKVSDGAVGWHIEHSLLTLDVILNALKNSDPGKYKWSFNFVRTLIMNIGKIPRGKAKAPQVVQPATVFNEHTLQQHISHSMALAKSINQLQPNHFFKHPYFGNLNRKPAIRFLQIHTQHHLRIINDIMNSKNER